MKTGSASGPVIRIAIRCAIFAALGPCAGAQTFTDFVARMHAAAAQSRPAMIDSFLAAHPQLPLVENDTSTVFIFHGAASAVSVAGDMNTWSAGADVMQPLAGSDLWYAARVYEADARLDYKYIVDGVWRLDPRNPRTCIGGFGPNSELRMPRCPEQPELAADPAAPQGATWDTSMTFDGGSRVVRVYVPNGYEADGARLPVILFHDGLDYLSFGSARTILNNLIAWKRIPPVLAVFVPAVQRSDEYSGRKMDAYARFIARDVMGMIDGRFATRADPRARALMGASDGGNISLYTGMSYPDVFGNIGAQSSNVVPAIAETFRNAPRLPLRIHLDLGTYDIPVLLPRVRELRASLQLRGYEHQYREYHEGHSWGNWRARIDDALVYFFGGLISKETPPQGEGRLELHNAYPHPAGGTLSIPFHLARHAHVRITINDSAGRRRTLVSDSMLGEGAHLHLWNTCGTPPGVYFCVLEAGMERAVRRIVVE